MFGRAIAVAERREFPRSALSAPVEVHIPSGVRRGVIIDLSRSGIGVEIKSPPAAGTPALVRWEDHEAMGQVVWERANSCGIRFDRPLAETLVIETVTGERRGPAASVSNIQTGQRRSAAWRREA